MKASSMKDVFYNIFNNQRNAISLRCSNRQGRRMRQVAEHAGVRAAGPHGPDFPMNIAEIGGFPHAIIRGTD